MKILITGAAGQIGSTLVKGMRQRHQLRGFDRVEMPDLADNRVGDVADCDALLAAAEGMEAIIHLTGVDSEWEKALSSNFIGTYNMLEAARIQGVRRVAYASRAGVHGPLPEDVMRHIDLRPQPLGYYTVSKLFGEHMGYSYAHRHDLEFVAVRIGNFNRKRDQPEHPHHLSHGDAVRVFEQAVVHPGVRYEIVYGVSDSTWPRYDLDHGRRAIGYYPQDKSDWCPEEE